MPKEVTVADDVDEILTTISAREKIPKGEVVEKIVYDLWKEDKAKRKRLDELVENVTERKGGEMDIIDKLTMYKMLMGGEKDASAAAAPKDPMAQMMQGMLLMTMMKGITQPDAAQQAQLQQAMQSGKPDAVKEILERQEKSQKEMMTTMMSNMEKLITGKTTTDQISELKTDLSDKFESMVREKEMGERIEEMKESVEDRLREIKESPKDFMSDAEKFVKNIGAIEGFAEKHLGMTKEEMLSKGGGINWNSIISKGMKTVETIAQRQPTETPPKGGVQELPENTCPVCGFPAQSELGLTRHLNRQHPELYAESHAPQEEAKAGAEGSEPGPGPEGAEQPR